MSGEEYLDREPNDPSTGLEHMYEQLASIREPFLKRARRCSELTIPSLLPQNGHNSTVDLPTPYQALGSRGVSNLASKILLAQLPPNQSFFRKVVDKAVAEKIVGDDPAKAEKLEESLENYEQAVMQKIEALKMRPSIHEAFLHDIVAGNVLIHFENKKKPKVYHLDKYVVQRAGDGTPLTIVVKECVSPITLPENVRKLINKKEPTTPENHTRTVDLYTGIILNENGKYDIWQEVCKVEIPGSRGSYNKDVCPWLPLRFTVIDGEDYGRSFVDLYLGDLISLEGLTQSVVHAAAACSKIVPLVNPNGMTKMSDVAKARNGQWIYGRKDDVTMLQADKQPDLMFTNTVIQKFEERLSAAFLLNSSIQRNAERVTAEEIRYMAAELEESLGGIYSILAHEFQLPLVNILIDQMTKAGELPKLPPEVTQTTIITGLEALSREHELGKLRMALQVSTELLGPEVTAQWVKPGGVLQRTFTALQVSPKGVIKTDEDVVKEQQAAQQSAMMQSIAPQAVKGGVDMAMQQREQQQESQTPEETPVQ